MKKSKKGLAVNELVLWIIALGVLVFIILLIVALKTKNLSILDSLKNFLRFGKNG